MKVSITEARDLADNVLRKIGFTERERSSVISNVLAAEMSGKTSHGLNKLLVIARVAKHRFDEEEKYFDYINLNPEEDFKILKESVSSLYIDGNYKTGFYVEDQVTYMILEKIKKSAVFITSIKNLGFATGYIGYYAKKFTEKGYIYLGFHNSSGGLIPSGSKEDPWGTNPITIGIPSKNNYDVIIDTAMSQITWNSVEKAIVNGSKLPQNSAKDEEGNDTIDPNKVFALNPISGHKGSALAMGVELLAGALSGSRIGFSKFGGWGATFVVINPEFFVGAQELENSVDSEIESLLNLSLASDSETLRYPGQVSQSKYEDANEKGYLDIDEDVLTACKDLLK